LLRAPNGAIPVTQSGGVSFLEGARKNRYSRRVLSIKIKYRNVIETEPLPTSLPIAKRIAHHAGENGGKNRCFTQYAAVMFCFVLFVCLLEHFPRAVRSQSEVEPTAVSRAPLALA
jgi:hypothetical protein